MQFLQPDNLDEALAIKAAHHDAVPIAGGTDLLVELNFDRRRPSAMVDISQIESLRTWSHDGDSVRLGSGVPFTRIIAELGHELPGLAIAARTVGSPQIRNRGTVGGNLGTASPAGDALAPLVACDARIEVASAARGTRFVAADEWIIRPKVSALEPDELIVAAHIPVARGPQQFSKVGTRNAMVIAACSFAVTLDAHARTIGTGIGSAGPTTIRARDAEEQLQAALDDSAAWDTRAELDAAAVQQFADAVAAAARPIDDVRGSAAYRRRALSVLARRTLTWAWNEYRHDKEQH